MKAVRNNVLTRTEAEEICRLSEASTEEIVLLPEHLRPAASRLSAEALLIESIKRRRLDLAKKPAPNKAST